MQDLISRQAAIDALNKKKIYRPLDSDRWVISDCLNAIVNLPSAQPEKRTEKRTETHECDCISRQAAIDILYDFAGCIVDTPNGDYQKAYQAYRHRLEILPSAQQRWIPCSERLPKQQQTVLIQDFGQTTIGYLNAENRWRDLTNLDDYLKGVEAWMPLPEPYREEGE